MAVRDQRLKVTEQDFRRQIVGPNGLATMLGWLHVGFRAAQTQHGWRTPVTGELGKGWPDLVLVHVERRRLLFRELKADGGRLSPDQLQVLLWLQAAGLDADFWTPDHMDSGQIQQELTA